MKSHKPLACAKLVICQAAGVLTLAAVSMTAHAQSSVSLEQVQQDLARYRCAGFNPVADETSYPADVERAGARLSQGTDCTTHRRPPTSPRDRDVGQSH